MNGHAAANSCFKFQWFISVSHILAKHLWFGESFPKMYEMMLIYKDIV